MATNNSADVQDVERDTGERTEGGREGEGCWKKINLQQRSSRDKTEDGEDVRRIRLSNLRSKTPERSGLNLPERRMRGDFSKYGSF